ncbi:MAG: sigma-70 family RNA polymerase sigma factor, partial [Verrucomicrobiales bacterium]|nr:sigma-70 family RNA polymerase sigma factor [Verrucomicrobiales bacterium]
TQGFFADILQRDWLENVGPEHGRFRTYLLHCLTNYLTNEWKRERGPQRRPAGGIVPLETGDAENRYLHEPGDESTPEKLFQRGWVATLVDQAKTRLRAECSEPGKLREFEILESHLADRVERGSITKIAQALCMTEGAVRVTIHRLRQRFRDLLRETVAETISNPADVDAEIRSLFTAWS